MDEVFSREELRGGGGRRSVEEALESDLFELWLEYMRQRALST